MSALVRYSPHVLAAALCLGLALANVLRAGGPLVATLAVAAACSSVALVGSGRFACLALALLLAGLWWGSARLTALDRSVLSARVGETARVQAVVTGPSRRSRFQIRVPAQLRRLDRSQLRESVLLELPRGRSPPQGAIVETIVKIERPRPPEDGFDEAGYLRRRGIHVVLKGGSWREVGRRGGLPGFADRLRAYMARTLAPGLRGERRAVLAGVVLGEDEGLSEELRDSFRASGLYHLLAVSGQNVVLVAGGMLGLAWLVGLPRWLGQLGALTAIAGYVAAVGWQPSVVRAGVAGALASLAWLAARPRDRWYFLLVGAGVLLAWNPYSVLEPGFQLSFSAVAAIFVAVPALQRRLEGYPVPVRLADVLAVSAACGLVTAPILWLQFGSIPLYSVLANALAWPAVAPLLGIALACTAVSPAFPQLAAALAWLNGWLAAYVAACARLVGSLPGAEVDVAVGSRSDRLALPRPARAAPAEATLGTACRGARPAERSHLRRRLAGVAAGLAASAAGRPEDHRARRRPGRLDPAAGTGGERARGSGPTRGRRRRPARPPGRETAGGARPDASAARPHRRCGEGAGQDPRRPRARPAHPRGERGRGGGALRRPAQTDSCSECPRRRGVPARRLDAYGCSGRASLSRRATIRTTGRRSSTPATVSWTLSSPQTPSRT